MAHRRVLQTLIRLKTLTPLVQSLPRITQTQHFPPKLNVIFPNSTPINNTHFTITRHFSSNRSGDSEDYDDEDDEEEEMGESLDEDDVVSGFSGKREYTAEEKESEANAIGYKVVGPLERSDRVFKDYEPVFAVIQIGSHQFKVSNGDCVYAEKLKFCEVHDKIILNKVLMLGSPTQTLIGRPILPDATVHAVVEEHALDAKVIIFKKKRRKNYRRTKGHRQELTKIRITDIQGIEKPVAPVVPEKIKKAAKEKVEKDSWLSISIRNQMSAVEFSTYELRNRIIPRSMNHCGQG
ncbi:50S ribosomal protein L21, mitochondrial [Heracleum sosnowskyi]|uniref:Large ribosomal subunit protein bL21m n=1 Tax=Heracleum sosnowskyi TaxID=360622 RepID=A0AAD8I3K6_9APIA|nr:50S ribosomal protein L21, mitochondrial [Heracleum sosnowskyi]